jgi:hypothetical protein
MKRQDTRRGFLGRSAVAAMGIGLAARAIGAEGQAPPSGTISMGFIGVGSMGSGDLAAFAAHKDVRVSAICDVNAPRREATVKRHEATAKGYHDFRKLLDEKSIDAVCIATPPHWHAIMAVHAAKAGKDFYVEKPMTLYVAESQAIVKAAKENNRVTQVGTQIHASGNYRRVVEAVRLRPLAYNSSSIQPLTCMRTGCATKMVRHSTPAARARSSPWRRWAIFSAKASP